MAVCAWMPWMATATFEHVAVCVSGQLRTAACHARGEPEGRRLTPMESLREYVLLPLAVVSARAPDVFAAFDTPPVDERQRFPGSSVDVLHHALDVLGPWLRQLSLTPMDAEELAWHATQEVPGGVVLKLLETANTSADPSSCERLARRLLEHFRSFNAHVQARRLGACWRLLESRERAMGVRYSHVLRLRPDHLLRRPLDLAASWLRRPDALFNASSTCSTPGAASSPSSAAAAPYLLPSSNCLDPGLRSASVSHWHRLETGHMYGDVCVRTARESQRTGPLSSCYQPCVMADANPTRAATDGDRSSKADSIGATVAHPPAWSDGSASAPDALMLVPNPNIMPGTFVHDHIYLVRRDVARPFFDHLRLLSNMTFDVLEQQLARYSTKAAKDKDPHKRKLQALCDHMSTTLNATRDALRPCPAYLTRLATHGVHRSACSDAREHECAIHLALAAVMGGPHAARTVRFLAGLPDLVLRVQDAVDCDSAIEAYRCLELPRHLRDAASQRLCAGWNPTAGWAAREHHEVRHRPSGGTGHAPPSSLPAVSSDLTRLT